MAWHPAEADMGAFVAQCPKEVHDMAYKRVFSIFALNRLQARHWVRVDYNIVLFRIHVPITVQCQDDGHSLSSKDDAVIWEWCRMLWVPVLVQRCGCGQVVVNWYGMLCHTQYIHNLAWSEQWSSTASTVCLCPLPTSSVQTTRMRFRASLHWVFRALMCFLKERRESHHSRRNFVDS